MEPKVEQELARVLLTELLAYQLASPVKWIDTQDVLLARKNIERLIEIGPSETLISMAKKTLAAQHKKHDALLSSKRKLLYYKKDQREIRYEVDPEPERAPLVALIPAELITATPAPASVGEAPKKDWAANDTGPEHGAKPQGAVLISGTTMGNHSTTVLAAYMPDAPVTAKEIVVTIIAQKLQKQYNSLGTDKSIKQLVGGRSTLENEIVGDLGAEFGPLPDKPEDMELDALCAELQSSPSFAGQLRKTSIALTTRLFSLKMPGGFNAAQARTYMSERWGFGPGRQDSVMFRASTAQPAARLASEGEARSFFDLVVKQYALDNALTLSSSNPSAGGMAQPVVLDTHDLAQVTKEQQARRRMKGEFSYKLHGVDPNAADRAALKSQKIIDALQARLDALQAELGDVFASGVLPMWSASKVRRYDSSWNWAIQDTFETFYEIIAGTCEPTDSDVLDRGILIANRSDSRLLLVMQHLLEKSWHTNIVRIELAKSFLKYVLDLCKPGVSRPFVAYKDGSGVAPSISIDSHGLIQYVEVPRPATEMTPTVHLKTSDGLSWTRAENLTRQYFTLLDEVKTSGLSFKNKNVLLTGAGPKSIGAEIMRGLLNGGARVLVTTSSYTSKTVRLYQEMYMKYGSEGSELIVAPFNQGSHQDVEALALYIFDPINGLGWDLDHVIPFAAVPENGREIDGIDSKSELSHRIMLTNVLRLLGAIKKQKESRGFDTRPTQIILPLSPNHGVFGNDGLYAESKIALETLFNKWHSESWSEYLSVCGVAIGWTRGTGLMAGNNILAADIEKEGLRTFSQPEMAFYTLLLMGRTIAKQNELQPIYADFTGGMSTVPDLKAVMTDIQHRISETTAVSKALALEEGFESLAAFGESVSSPDVAPLPEHANIQFDFPKIPSYNSEIGPLATDLQDMVNLDRVVVVTGFSEVGPFGNARTRWEMEANGKFSLEGCVEMAWIMGLIKSHDGILEGEHYVGWIDAKSKKAIRDCDIKSKYESQIIEHTGIRLIEPELDEGYDPQRQQFLQEIVLEEDLPPFQVPQDLATDFQREHNDLVDIFEVGGGGDYSVRLKKGATLLVPKALRNDRNVGGQIPTGWDARTYGISDDIIAQVDRITLFALVSTAEALISSGLTDPYEMYKHLHVSEIGNCVGSGVGGQMSNKRMFKTRYVDKPVQNDVLQETFINTTAAWINMLLLSSSGPIRTPVGACATSLESLETGFETIMSGKAKMCLVGGFDDMTERVASEFANMKATANNEQEYAKGRDPKDMSRPTTTTRSGFVESQGGGVQVVTSARLAIDMGLPIHGIVAWVGTSSDKIGRSVPAPGKGILVNAREKAAKFPSPLLDLKYRKRRLELRKRQIQESLETELDLSREELGWLQDDDGSTDAIEHVKHRMLYLRQEARRQEKDAMNTFGNDFWHELPDISPIRGALAVWGLTIDDLDVASFHGTSTKKNDTNETEVVQKQLSHLGRSVGNPVLGIFQKYMTGHAKGGAGAWMLNGCLQVLDTGIVPGNRNADNIDAKLRESDLIVYPSRTLQTPGVKAFSVTSFGFGQKGAQAIGVHPRYLFATLGKAEYQEYSKKVQSRHRKAFRSFHHALATNTMFVAKDTAPYNDSQESAVLLNPQARVFKVNSLEEYSYDDDELVKGIL
ncbi:hypothetical protein MMC15_002189 [Xylographa vitiligo]|nr:hypothetical protein [Xylographa vitiligo]